jgi:HSP20 family protein
MLIRRIPSVPSWTSVLHDLEDVHREMTRMFGGLPRSAHSAPAGVFPAINVSETSESLLVQAEIPGVKVDDLEITVEDNTLSVKGERKIEPESGGVRYHRREREAGVFHRAFELPVRVDAERVSADYTAGILTITLPKAEDSRPKQIPIQVS